MAKRDFLGLIVVSNVLGAAGQLFFKMGLNSNNNLLLLFLAVGLVAYGISTIMYFFVLSRERLSWVYGLVGLSYIFATILAYFVLKEPMPMVKIAGISVITIGIGLIGVG